MSAYEKRVRALEAQGLTRGDAQAAVDAEEQRKPHTPTPDIYIVAATDNPGFYVRQRETGDLPDFVVCHCKHRENAERVMDALVHASIKGLF